MRDEIDGRIWATHHQAFSDDFDKFIVAVRDAFAGIHKVQFAAPWRKDTRRRSAG
jgi:hypothetical protein